MPRARLPRPFAAIAIASAVACGTDPIVLCACSRNPPHTILYGTATGPAGQVVPGTSVLVQEGPVCGDGSLFKGPVDEAGRYRTIVLPRGDYAQLCIRVWAIAPEGSGFRNSDTLRFTLPTPATATDSVRRDISLRAP
jgi:hypothetical protein